MRTPDRFAGFAANGSSGGARSDQGSSDDGPAMVSVISAASATVRVSGPATA